MGAGVRTAVTGALVGLGFTGAAVVTGTVTGAGVEIGTVTGAVVLAEWDRQYLYS